MKFITSTEAKSNLGEVFANINQTGPIHVTTHGRVVGVISPPVSIEVDKAKLATMAKGYADGEVSWKEIRDQLDLSYGELLEELSTQGLKIPRFSVRKTAEQEERLFELFAANAPKSSGSDR